MASVSPNVSPNVMGPLRPPRASAGILTRTRGMLVGVATAHRVCTSALS